MIELLHIPTFQLAFTNNKEHAERCMAHPPQGVMYSDRLDKAAHEIAGKWTHGDYYEAGCARNDYYCNVGGDFARVSRDLEEEDMPVRMVSFVSPTMEGLAATVQGFDLPFDKTHVLHH